MLEKSPLVVHEAVRDKLAQLLRDKVSDPVATARSNQLFLEAVLWWLQMGAPWRDLPGASDYRNGIVQQSRRWVKGDALERVFTCLSDELDFEYSLIDGTFVTVHQKAGGARGGNPRQCDRPLARQPDD